MIDALPIDIPFVSLFDSLADGVLWLESIQDGQSSAITDFRVVYRNNSAKIMLPPVYQLAPGNYLLSDNDACQTELLPWFTHVSNVITTGTTTERYHFDGYRNRWLSLRQAKADRGVLLTVRVVAPDEVDRIKPVSTPESGKPAIGLLETILATSLQGIVAYEAIRDGQGQIIDFRIQLVNEVARRQGVALLSEPTVGRTLREFSPGSEQDGSFRLFVAVCESGEPFQGVHHYVHLDQWANVAVTKLNDGVLVTFNNITEAKKAESKAQAQADLLQSILNNSLNGIASVRALRDDTGQIVDFIFETVNVALCELAGVDADVLLRDSVLTRRPVLKETEVFNQGIRVYETGISYQTEYYTPQTGRWFDVSMSRQGSEHVVITVADISQLKATTYQVEQQAQTLSSVLNGSINSIVAYQAIRESGKIVDFRISLVNRAAEVYLKQTADQLVGHTMLELFPEEWEMGLFAMYVETVETGQPSRANANYHVVGRTNWLDISATRLDDGLVVTFIDITDVRSSMLEKQQQAELLNSILDNSGNGIIACQVKQAGDGRVTDLIVETANRAAEEFIGTTLGEMKGASLLAIYPDQHELGLLPLCIRAVESHRLQRREAALKTGPDVRWIDVSVAPLDDGVVVTLINITETKQAALELEAQTVMLRDVVNGAINGILLLEAIRSGQGQITDFCIQAANQATLAMTGSDPVQMTNKRMSEIFPTYREAGFFDAYVQTIATGEPQRVESYYPTDSHGLEGWFAVSAVKQGADGVVLTFVNTTEAKKAELERQALITELQRSNANLEQFAYVASHDLQEPLRKVTAFGDVLQSQFAPVLGETGTDLIQRMQSATGRMQVLIRDLLAYSRVVSKYDPLGILNLNQLVADVALDLETIIQEKQAILTIEPLPELRGDALQWRQLIQNLLSNALKFTRPGVQPAIQIRCHVVRGQDVPAVPPGQKRQKFYCIEVVDNGIGFDPKYADRIFQVFQRLHGRSQYAGTGIGLAIVQKVVENHKGCIIAEGQPGQGATFKILLPISDV